MATNKDVQGEPDQGRLITLNISFQEYALLSLCVLSTIYPFHEKTQKNGGKLTNEQDQALVAFNSIDKLLMEQAQESTSELNPMRLKTNLDEFLRLRKIYQDIIFDILEENFKKNFEAITGKKL